MKDRALKILYVIQASGYGGAERRLVRTLRALARDRIEPRLLILGVGGQLERGAVEAGVETRVAPRSRLFLLRWFQRFNVVLSATRRFGPDVIHAWDPLSGAFGRVVGLLRSVPVISGFNSSRSEPYRVRFVERWLSPLTKLVVVNSEMGRDWLVTRCKVPRDKVVVSRQGLDPDELDNHPDPMPSVRATLGLAPDRPLIGLLGKHTPDKDPLVLVAAARLIRDEHPEAAFCIVGSGPLREEVIAAVAAHSLEETFFLIPEHPQGPWLARDFDIGVLTSRQEGLPNALLEYMYWAKPAVVTSVGECPRVVVDGETGYVVPPGSPELTALALRKLLDDPDRMKRMGASARKRLTTEFGMDRYIGELEALYHRVLGSPLGPGASLLEN